MGQTVPKEKEKLTLIPPQIKPKRRVPLYRSDFDVLGRAVDDLVHDFFPDNDTVQVNLFLKPNLPAEAPDVGSFTSVGVSAGERGREPNIHGGLAVEALVPDTNLRAAAGIHISGGEPNLVLSVDHRPTDNMRWFLEGNPQNYFGGGASFNYRQLSAGVYSRSFMNRRADGENEFNDKFTSWASFEMPAVMLGARADITPSDAKKPVQNVDLAIAFFDPTSTNMDRPTFEIAAVAKDLGKSFSLSYFQHFVLRRKIYNPLEQDHITHIVNYVDIGTKISVDDKRNATMGVAASWQLNKNHMWKAKVDNHRLSLAWVFKNWSYPSFAFTACSKYDWKTNMPSVGATLNIQTSFGGDFENVSADYESAIVKYQATSAPKTAPFERMEQAANPAKPAAEPVKPPVQSTSTRRASDQNKRRKTCCRCLTGCCMNPALVEVRVPVRKAKD